MNSFITSLVVLTAIALPLRCQNVSTEGLQIKPYIYENAINETIQEIKKTLKNHDPYIIPELDWHVEQPNLHHNLKIKDAIVREFSDFTITALDIKMVPPKLKFSIHFNKLQMLIPFYDLDTLISFVPIYGNGILNIRVTQVDIDGSASMRFTSAGASIKNLYIDLKVNETDIRMTGFLHNEPLSSLISRALSESLPEFIERHSKRLRRLLASIIEAIINNQLKKN